MSPDERQRLGDALGRVDVSIVIPVLNGAATIGEQLDALLAQDFAGPLEIIVADNGSTDGTRDVVARYASRSPIVRLVDASRKRGVNAARNAGARAARSDKVLFCDADDIVSTGWASAMARALDLADGCGGLLEFRRLNPHLQHLEPRSAVFCERETRWPLGACCGWRRPLLIRLGGYDESWQIGGDDVEFGLRAARAGARIAEAPEAILHKRERASRWDLARQFYKYGRTRPRLISTHPDLADSRTTRAALRQWVRTGLQLVRGRTDHQTVRRAAYDLGRIVGSIEHRYWAP